jgi:hypothetical protein
MCFSSIFIIYIIHRVLLKKLLYFFLGGMEVCRLSVPKEGDEFEREGKKMG